MTDEFDRTQRRYLGGGVEPAARTVTAAGELEAATHADPVARSQWSLFRRRFLRHKGAVISTVVLILLTVACFSAHWLAPYDPKQQDLLLGPVGPGAKHWFGTDELGRDQLSRLLQAGQISLKIGFSVALISTVLGTAIGAIAGYFRSWPDQILMWVTDLFLVVPQLAVLALALNRLGRTDTIIILVVSFIFWMSVARVVRGQVLSIREKEFVEAAKASGASPWRVMVRHIIPNIIGPIMVNATLGIAAAILTESTLSFLGFGVDPPSTSWGQMLSDAKGAVGTDRAYLIYAPGLAILITVLCVNFIGDGLRDAFDPQDKH